MAKTVKSGTHLFIDTNILLSFYSYSKDDLEQLDKLIKLIHAKTIKLYLTQQVVDEFSRNREAKLAESFQKFRFSANFGCPDFMLHLPEYKLYKKTLTSFEKAHEGLIQAARVHSSKKTLAADELFSQLLDEANIIEITEETYGLAYRRSRLGNPPGKSSTIGDELNWEMLLSSVRNNSDLHLISKDGDYASKLDSVAPKSFLVEEWAAKRSGKLHLYEQIGQFFQANFPKEEFSLAIEKRDAIDALLHSGNFQQTHSAIALLDPYLPFLTGDEAEEIALGALSNSQVRWLMCDSDVEIFFKGLLEEHQETLSLRVKERLEESLGMEENHEE